MRGVVYIYVCGMVLLTGVLYGQPGVIDDPDGLLTKKEKRQLEAAIAYETDFYNRAFTGDTVDFSQIRFTVTPDYLSYMLYQARMTDKVAQQSAGFYSPEDRELVVCKGERYKDTFLGTCFHELSHAFLHLHADGRRLPAWLDEGLAEYLEHMTYASARVKHRTDSYLLARVKTLIGLREVNLREFVTWDYRKFAAESFSQEAYGYAVGYCMVLYLMQERGEEQAFALFRALMEGEPTIRVFDRCYEGGFGQFEKDFMTHFE